MSKYLTMDEILAQDDLKREVVAVSEWKAPGGGVGEVLVRELTSKERDDYEQSLMDAQMVGKKVVVKPKFQMAKARMAVKCIIDENGERVFEDKDVAVLATKSAAAINRIVDVIERLSGMSKEDIKGLEGNLGAGQAASSPSA